MDLQKLGGMLQQAAGGGGAQAEEHFDQAAASAPREHMAEGLAEAFRSSQTPPFPQMLGQLFGRSTGEQKAGLLNQLIGSGGGGLLSGVLGNLGGGQVTPEQAERVDPRRVEEAAAQAERDNPSIVDTISRMYAQHPGLIKALGGAALSIAMAKIAERQSGSR
jgi:hypothetical protein